MPKNMPVYAAAAGPDIQAAAALPMRCAYLAYSIGPGGELTRGPLPARTRGGLLGLSDHDAPPLESLDSRRLEQETAAECGRRGYAGALLDFERPDYLPLALSLCQRLTRQGLVCYGPLTLAAAPDCRLLVPSSISGGSFQQMLEDYCRRFPPERLALDVVRVCAQYDMPSLDPDGQSLSVGEFRQILERHAPTPFFSQQLCAKYFTYRTKGKTRFVLYDDLASTMGKLSIAARQGFCAAFVLYRDFGPACAQLAE